MFRMIRSLILLSLIAAGPVLASETPFEQAKFDSLQKNRKPILVVIHADWCPTCKTQEAIVGELLKIPELRDLNALRVDFDKQMNVVKAFRAQYQSTLIIFKSGKEVGRSTGDTRRESIAALLKKAL